MSEKVKLPREVATALDVLIPSYEYPTRCILDIIYKEWLNGTNETLAISTFCESDRSRRVELLAKALVNGYEVEETPEEMVRRYFEDQNNARRAEQEDGSPLAIVTVLDILNIKIDGVNA